MRTCVLLVLVATLLEGCSSATMSRGQTAGRDYDGAYEYVYAAVKSVLMGRGYEIAEEDPDTGKIETNWVEVGGDRTQTKAQITRLEDHWARVDLEILHDEKGFLGGDWKPQEVKTSVYEDLFDDIDLQVYREYFLKIQRPNPDTK
jgi:hypothetical protein